ncbi:MAG: hypothetical protein ACRDZ4_14330 [Egibacteraceae bacterium]
MGRPAGAARRRGQVGADGARDLAEREPRTRVVRAVRSLEPDWGVVADDPLPQRQGFVDVAERLAGGEVSAVEVRRGVAVESLAERDGRVAVTLRGAAGDAVGTAEAVVDRVLALTGYVGDASISRQRRSTSATPPPRRCSCPRRSSGTGRRLPGAAERRHRRAPQPLGMKSYGPELRIGYDQVDDVASAYVSNGSGHA